MAKIGIIFGSSTGNTEAVAEKLKDSLGDADLISVSADAIKKVQDYDVVLLGSSTWGLGDLQDDWEGLLEDLGSADLNGKKVGFFGTGDQDGYPDTFVDAIGLLYEAVEGSGADFIGATETDGFNYEESKAVKDGKFVGLVIDEDNQADASDERIENWVNAVKAAI